MLKIRIVVVLFSTFLLSCASTKKNRDAQALLKRLTSQGKYTEAISLVKSDKFFPEERSKLLKTLELGNLHYLNGEFYQALKIFDSAKELSDKLYTKSISKKITAALINANQDNYYGERFERSFLRFYLGLLHYRIYRKGEYEAYSTFESLDNGKQKETKHPEKKLSDKEKRQHLFAARAMILEWDTLLENYKQDVSGISTYKTDLMAKILGAIIHEEIGTRTDRNIAKQLYKDAKKVLFKYYNLYPTFNFNHEKFAKDYEKLPKLKKSKIKKEYIAETEYAKSLVAFIDSRLKDLKNRKSKRNNIKILLKEGYVAKKKPKKVDFPLPMFRLGYVSGRKTSLFVFTLEMLAISQGTKPTISFELPGIEEKTQGKEYFAVIKNAKGKELLREKIVLINPMSEIAAQTMENDYSSAKKAIGTRVAAKHVAAILASYKIYEAQPNALGKITAGLAYAASNKAIAASEKIDLRQWTTLPHNIRMASFTLKPGKEYLINIEEGQGKAAKVLKSKKLTIDKNKSYFLDFNVY